MSVSDINMRTGHAKILKMKVGNSVLAFGFGIAIFYWILNALLQFLAFGHYNFKTIFIGTEFELYEKLMVSALFVIFGSHVKESLIKRQQAEEKLMESEAKYRSMMVAMKDAAYICSPEYKIEYMNPAMEKRIGKDAVGKPCHEAIYNRADRCSWCVFEKIQKHEYFEYELNNPEKDEFLSITNSPIPHADGSISKLTIFRDISNIKKYEKRLQQTQKLETIGTLAGGIAHDFNNILSPIIGFTDILKMDIPEDSPSRNDVDQIHQGAMRAKDLVQQILTFARQDDTKLEPMKIQPVINEALKLIRSSIPKKIAIEQDIQADCGLIVANPTQIHQIVMNLVTNASHAMEGKAGKIKVGLKEVRLGNADLKNPKMVPSDYACLKVSDDGKGMNQKILDQIFDPFFTTKDLGKGTGMGLSVVHGIIEAMGGDIQVASEPGKGTEFTIYFPVEK